MNLILQKGRWRYLEKVCSSPMEMVNFLEEVDLMGCEEIVLEPFSGHYPAVRSLYCKVGIMMEEPKQ